MSDLVTLAGYAAVTLAAMAVCLLLGLMGWTQAIAEWIDGRD